MARRQLLRAFASIALRSVYALRQEFIGGIELPAVILLTGNHLAGAKQILGKFKLLLLASSREYRKHIVVQ